MDHNRLVEILDAWDAVKAAGSSVSYKGFEIGFVFFFAIGLCGLVASISSGFRNLIAAVALVIGGIGAGFVLVSSQKDPAIVKFANFRATYCPELVQVSVPLEAMDIAKKANCPRPADPSYDAGPDMMAIMLMVTVAN